MFDDLIFALKNFKRNRIRTFLSLLGIIIGVASVIVITSLSESANQSIKKIFASSGLDLVEVYEGRLMRGRNAVMKFTESFRSNLFDSVENIKGIYYVNNVPMTLSKGDSSSNASAVAIENGYLDIRGLSVEKGSNFSISDNVTGQQKIIIGPQIVKDFFPNEDPIGKSITGIIQRKSFNFIIVGVLAPSNGMMQSDNLLFVPRGFYTKKVNPNLEAAQVVVQCTSQNKATTVASHIEQYVAYLTGSENAASVSSMQAMLDQYDEATGTVSLILSGIAAISLLVGGIGIMNIMIVTVTERKREIGIRKALGASPFVICVQFLVESALITVLGGIVGIIFGIAISGVAALVMKQVFVIQLSACFFSFIFSVAIGIFFGLSPAVRASKLDPVEALASE